MGLVNLPNEYWRSATTHVVICNFKRPHIVPNRKCMEIFQNPLIARPTMEFRVCLRQFSEFASSKVFQKSPQKCWPSHHSDYSLPWRPFCHNLFGSELKYLKSAMSKVHQDTNFCIVEPKVAGTGSSADKSQPGWSMFHGHNGGTVDSTGLLWWE